MRNLILSALILASAFQTALGQIVEGQWAYIVEDGGATITISAATGAVIIPSVLGEYNVKKVGSNLGPIFGYNDTRVTSITIPNSVTSIGDLAFTDCTRLTSITIPNSVTSIGHNAFNNCPRLTSITLDSPSSLTSIGNNAFSNCTRLTSITIPSSVTSIGSSAFSYCDSLTSITLVDGLPAIGSGWFEGIPVTSIIIPNSVTSIGNHAFSNCTGLASITIPDSVTSIGNYAFYGCTSLASITIPSSVTSIGDSAFSDCTSLANITMPDRFITKAGQIGISGEVATDYLINALANNDAFVTAVANKIKATGGNYGLSVKSELETLATKSGLSSAISTAVQPLATKTELTSALTESRTAGVNSVLSNPNLWTLYTTSQIQNMAVGDLVLTRQVSGGLSLTTTSSNLPTSRLGLLTKPYPCL